MRNHSFSLDVQSPSQTFQIIRKIRIKTEIQLNQNNPCTLNLMSFRNPAIKIKSHRSNHSPVDKKQKVTIFFSQGLKYQGEVFNQKFDGFGIISKNDIELYVGSFKKGSFQGCGRLMNSEEIELGVEIVFQDWVAYSGEFKEGLFHGMGTLILENGEKFLGRFEEGKLVKEGVYHTEKNVYVGEWDG